MRVECCNLRVGQDRAPHFHIHVPKNARAILPDTSNVPLDLSCVTIARRHFMIGFSYFTVLINHTFDALKFEIKTFIQPFANFIKGAHS